MNSLLCGALDLRADWRSWGGAETIWRLASFGELEGLKQAQADGKDLYAQDGLLVMHRPNA